MKIAQFCRLALLTALFGVATMVLSAPAHAVYQDHVLLVIGGP